MTMFYIFVYLFYLFIGWLLSDLCEGDGFEGMIVFLFWPIVFATIIIAGLISIIYTLIRKGEE